MCLFLFAGSILSVQSQPESEYRMLACSNGECETTVVEIDGGWTQSIWCGGDEVHEFSGTGSYGGSVCGMTMQ